MPAPAAVRSWLLWWIALAALWLALTDTRKLPELATGAAAAAVGASAAAVVRALGLIALRPRPAWVARAGRSYARAPLDCLLLTAAVGRRLAGRPVAGRFRELPFPATEPDEARAQARRVLASVAGSAAPNRYVAYVDFDRERLLVHELVPRGEGGEGEPIEPA
jgi:hypothetical protein